MNGQQSTPGVLVLYPVKFAGATPNMIVNPPPPFGVPAEALPRSSFSVVTKRDGSREGAVQAIVDPPADPYWNIVLYMKGPSDKQAQLIERRPVDPADPNKQVVFYVFQSQLTNGVHVFFYEVERDSGNSGPSTEYWALYYRELPGGNDVPGNGPHPALSIQFDPQAGDNPSFDKDDVDKGVPLTLFYSFMEPYDKITLEIGTQRFEFILQPDEVGRPYVIVVTRQMFEQVGSHPAMPFSFTVVRQTNDPTDKRRWSRIIKADVDIDRVLMLPPALHEKLNDDSDLETIDLNLVEDVLYVQLHANSPPWQSGDTIRLEYSCTPPSGPVVTHSEDKTWKSFPVFEVPVAKVLSGGTVEAKYHQVRGNTIIATSRVATAQVIGENVDELAITGIIPVGTFPHRLAIDPSGTRLYVSNSDTVSVINTGTSRVVGSISIQTPEGLAISPDGEHLYVNSAAGDALLVFHTGNLTELSRFAVGPLPYGIALNKDGRRAYVSSTNGSANSHVCVIDTTTMALIGNIEVGSLPYFVAVNSNDALIYVSNLHSHTVSVIDATSQRVIAEIPIPSPAEIVFSPDGLRAYVGSQAQDARVSVIDTRQLTVTSRIRVGRVGSYVAISPDGKHVYVSVIQDHALKVIDAKSLTVRQSIPVHDPNGLVVTPSGRYVYVCNSKNNTVTVLGYV